MARKRVTEPQLMSWEQVDDCLKVMSDAENQISVITAEMNAAIAEIKSDAEKRAAQFKETIKQNEGKIKEFTTIRKEDLKGKSKQLTFGTVGFRQSTKLLLSSDTEEVIKKLRENGMADCITVKETINKDTVKSYPEDDILRIGGYLQKTDTFWYETDKDRLAEAAE
ncbi:MAG: host-nuclease inhibitor Gam family protein [Lachnospiraceae bacterium]|nr:host-nuclease inhibitor Gam family protein [Lachnospiraceae bacterium]